MKRIPIDYHVDGIDYAPVSSEIEKQLVDQRVVDSVFIVNPVTGHLDDALSQVVSDPSNIRNDSLMPLLQKVGKDVVSGLSDDDLLTMCRSRYCQTPSEVNSFASALRSFVDSSELVAPVVPVEPSSPVEPVAPVEPSASA